ncbi:unnamed protein product [Amoebophrya sp. A25]|nr:unnamed protein product [Amoebophrya sp. A25]|eukprot:GSA25T00006714001.1
MSQSRGSETAEDIQSFSQLKEEANTIVKAAVSRTVGGRANSDEIEYDPKLVQGWIEEINTNTLDKLQQMSQGFKFIVSTTVVQKNGAGIHVSSTCFWEQNTDGNLTFRWENRTMYVIIQVFGLAL